MKSSHRWALLFALIAVVWIASGRLLPSPGAAPGTQRAETSRQQAPLTVEVIPVRVTARPARLALPGHAEATAVVNVAARTGGIVEATPRPEGATVKKGDVLCRLDAGARGAQLEAARAALASARRDYDAALKLFRKGHATKARLQQLKARVDEAAAREKQLKLDIARTRVRAPIDGVLAAQVAKVGDLLAPGRPCAQLVKLDPLKVVARASEVEIRRIRPGAPATARLVTGQRLSGRITYISPRGDPATHTFRVEMQAPNPQAAPAQVSARMTITLPPRPAARLPLAAIVLADDGRLGVRVVNKDDTVAFVPVQVLDETRQGASVAGLKDGMRVIVTGQHYVLAGQKVKAVPFSGPRDDRS